MAVEIEMRLMLVAGEPFPMRARFRYESTDPYAVQTCFQDDAPTEVVWTFARDLLVAGLDRPAGSGDVRVWPIPWLTGGGERVALSLSSPDGCALFEIPRARLARFLRRTFAAVPRGREPEYQDVDAAIARLLGQRWR